MTGITCSKMNPKTEHLKSFSQTDLAAVRQTSSTRQKSFILLSLSIMAATTSNKINIKLYHVMVLYLVCTSRSGSIKSYILFSHYTCVASFKTGSFFKIKLQFLCISFISMKNTTQNMSDQKRMKGNLPASTHGKTRVKNIRQ